MNKRNLMFVLVASVTAVNTMAYMPNSNVYAKEEVSIVQEKNTFPEKRDMLATT